MPGCLPRHILPIHIHLAIPGANSRKRYMFTQILICIPVLYHFLTHSLPPNCSRHGQKYLNPSQARIFFLSLVNMDVRATSGQFHLAAKKRVQLCKVLQQTTFPTRLQEAQQPILCEYID
ncbi:uncharacterized protein Bfra_004664 [Botrytis fragariae]|uniref:Uncharacterized protein n=1 Tax=Botrytis fragariae TaxID=1964551 RepID=A0A8H6EJK9_9HELO|nr:uncharacterized protein Bfra_004664 [Botrytis fragariae]KAF5874651.1 hypothetical protein Bfra_004664 [Botrytis fragariae]